MACIVQLKCSTCGSCGRCEEVLLAHQIGLTKAPSDATSSTHIFADGVAQKISLIDA